MPRTLTNLMTRNEAAEFSGASVSVINKAIENRLVVTIRRQRRALLQADDVSVLAVFARLGVGLTVSRATKQRIAVWARAASPGAEFPVTQILVLRMPPEIAEARAATDRYLAQRERFLEINPDVHGGEPVIRGTRVPIRGLAKQIGAGETYGVLAREYDYIDPEAFEFAVRWARANPRRGRPVHAASVGHEPGARRERLRERRARSAPAA